MNFPEPIKSMILGYTTDTMKEIEKQLEENHLMKLLELFPDKEWDYKLLSANPNITWDYIQNHPDKGWDYAKLSENPSITLEIILDNPDLPWHYDRASANPNITLEDMKNNPNIPWDFSGKVACNPNITWEIVKNNPQIEWSYQLLSKNPNITIDIILDNPDKNWNYYYVSRNPNITFRQYVNIPKNHLHYSWYLLDGNNVTWQDIADYPYTKNFYDSISASPLITWEDITNHLELKDARCVYANPNITLDIIKNSEWLTANLTFDLSINPNLTWSYIQETYGNGCRYIFPWLSKNLFNKHPLVYDRLYKKYKAELFTIKDIGKIVASYT